MIGFIGLGDMGGALARRPQLMHPLFVYDINPDAVRRMVENGAIACKSLSELASRCEVILICLPTSDHVRSVIFGTAGLADALRPALRAGTTIIDQTTGEPMATRAMAAELAKSGINLIDAPVSGGPQGAEAGTIAIMVGGTLPQLQRVHHILAAISPNIFHTGSVGAGQVMKLVNNMLSGAQRLLTLESVALAVKNGIASAKAVEVLLAGGARNSFLEKFMGSQVIKGDLGTAFTLGLMHKDLKLACQLGSDSGVPLFFANLSREFYQMCISERGPGDRVNTAALVMDRLAGTQVVPGAS